MTQTDWDKILYFHPREFDSPDLPGSGMLMDATLVRMLDDARGLAGIPFKISSGYRTAVQNVMVGGRPLSAHLTWEAADVVAIRPETRFKVLKALFDVGFERVEVAPRHIHVDVKHDDAHPSGIALFLDTVTGNLV